MQKHLFQIFKEMQAQTVGILKASHLPEQEIKIDNMKEHFKTLGATVSQLENLQRQMSEKQ